VNISSEDDLSVIWLFDESESLVRDDLLAGEYIIQISQGVCDSIFAIDVPDGEGVDVSVEIVYTPCSAIGGNIIATPISGQGPYEFIWEDGAMDSIRLNLSDGTYILTVTDALGCTGIVSTDIENVTGLDFSTDIIDVSCYGFEDGSISVDLLSGTPPYTVVWEDGSDELFRDSLPVGTYSVSINDVNNCNITLNRVVRGPDILGVQICINEFEELEAKATGGTPPYNFDWNDGSSGPIIIDPMYGFEYEVLVTDANDCQEIAVEVFQTDSVDDFILNTIEVYPNPSLGLFNIVGDVETQIQSMLVYDISGHAVFKSNTMLTNAATIDLTHLHAGTYILEAHLRQGIFRKKLVIVNE